MSRKRYHDYLRIPEQQIGEWAVEHSKRAPGWESSTGNIRTAMFGAPSRQLVFPEETTWHFLKEGGGIWMSDLPIEQAQHDRLLREVRGRVLIGGLGLGYSAQMLARRKKVEHVTVIEKSPEVVKLVVEHLRVPPGKLTVIIADLFDWLDGRGEWDEIYDWAFYDIWQRDSESTLHEIVLPLIRKTKRMARRILCWNENVMRGQLRMGLFSRCGMPLAPTETMPGRSDFRELQGSHWHDWCVPFFQWLGDRELTRPAQQALVFYADIWGRPGWEDRWEFFSEFCDKRIKAGRR